MNSPKNLHFHTPNIYLCLFSLLFVGCASGIECIPAERTVLLRIKQAFSSPESHCLVSWTPSSNCCNWYGVTCHAQSRHVTEISLNSCEIYGELPNDLFTSIKNLTLLDLSDNTGITGVFREFPENSSLQTFVLSAVNMSGGIPDSIGNLKHLTDFQIASAGMTGALPSSIGSLTRLITLDVSGNRLTGEIPSSIGSLTRLITLDVSGNRLTGEIPSSIGSLTKLITLDVSGNGLTGEIPSSIGSLTKLITLDVSGNGLTGEIPSSIGSLTKLITLAVSGNGLTGEIPSSIGNLAHLEYLNFGGNNFEGTIPESIGSFVNLTYMFFSSNNLTGVIPSSIRHFAKLEYMYLAYNSLSGQIPMSLFSLPSLTEVYLNDNHLSGQIEEFLNPSTTLRSIDLGSNQIGGQIPKSLLKLPALGMLSLTSNNFNGTLDLDLVATLGSLTSIDISYNRIWVQESNYNYFQNFPMLYSLGFASCNLTKVPRFLKLQNLIGTLDLSNNKISGNIPRWIWTLESMMYLNLSNNRFMHMETPVNLTYRKIFTIDLSFNVMQGPIPLPPLHIRHLDYSNNNFSYAIPTNFSLYLNDIAYLSFANNSLIGEIPQSIGQSTDSLAVLDLSNNYLTGPIPPNIFNSSSLVLLKLNGNDLEGAIPSRIKKGCQLRAILVGENHLNGTLPKSLLNCSELLVLDLANNHLSGQCPIWLGNFANLRVLILKGNGFDGPMEFNENIDSKNQFSKIQVLDISSNSITGNLPSKLFSNLKAIMNASTDVPGGGDYVIWIDDLSGATFGTLDNEAAFDYGHIVTVTSKGYSFTVGRILKIFYTFVDFSNNYFEGNIPNVISKLDGLHFLNLSHNALTGNIPPSLGKMVQLQTLDLSENQLLGSIPPELASLTFLAFLNLSKNSLSGPIPQRGQLQTFANNSFDGNPNLCGTPLSKLCVNNSPSAISPVSSDPDSSSTYVIGMAFSAGLGYGFGIAMFFLYQTVSWKHWMKKIARTNRAFVM